jgi:hypothetical protein
MNRYRFRYWVKKACKFVGLCYRCRSSTLYYTPDGTGICSHCGLRH